MSSKEEVVQDAAPATEVVKIKKEKKDKSKKKDKQEKKEKKVKKEKKLAKDEPVSTTSADGSADKAVVSEESSVQPETAGDKESPVVDSEVTTDVKPKKRKRAEGEEDTDGDKLEIDVDAPAPLSKAQARAEKKKAKKSKKEPTEGDEDVHSDGAEKPKKKAKKEKSDEPPKRKNSVWIGNLSFKASPDSLRSWFTRKLGGDVDVNMDQKDSKSELVTRVNLPMKPGRNRWGHQECKGFAYVDFATPELQSDALKLSETLLDGRKVLIKLGDDYTADPDARTPKPLSVPAGSIPKNQLHKESSSLFMGNLPFDSTEEEIREFVEANVKAHTDSMRNARKNKTSDDSESDSDDSDDEESDEEEEVDEEDDDAAIAKPKPAFPTSTCGLKKVRMPTFEDSGKCKGFAFIDFNSPSEATYALAVRANRFFRGGRKLNLQYASESSTQRSMSRNKRMPPSDGARPSRPPRYFDQAAEGDSTGAGQSGQADGMAREERRGGIGKKWEAAGRPRPGAALAMAKRENVGIVESQGKKITF